MTLQHVPYSITVRNVDVEFIMCDVSIEWPGMTGNFSIRLPKQNYSLAELWSAARKELLRIAQELPDGANQPA